MQIYICLYMHRKFQKGHQQLSITIASGEWDEEWAREQEGSVLLVFPL